MVGATYPPALCDSSLGLFALCSSSSAFVLPLATFALALCRVACGALWQLSGSSPLASRALRQLSGSWLAVLCGMFLAFLMARDISWCFAAATLWLMTRAGCSSSLVDLLFRGRQLCCSSSAFGSHFFYATRQHFVRLGLLSGSSFGSWSAALCGSSWLSRLARGALQQLASNLRRLSDLSLALR